MPLPSRSCAPALPDCLVHHRFVAALVPWLALAGSACRASTHELVSRAQQPLEGAPRTDSAPISADRPGFLFAPTVVPRGRLQVEMGPMLTVFRDGGDEARAWTLPIALRYGASDRLELRASLPTWTETRVESGAASDRDEGLGDTEIGAKVALPELAGGPLALQGSLFLPTGADDFTTDELGATGFLIHGLGLGSFELQSMLGLSYFPIADAEDRTSGALAALLSHPLGDGWSTYVEAAAFPGLNHSAGQSYVGTALVWTPRDDVQLDVSADFGLDGDSADVIASVGVAWLF